MIDMPYFMTNDDWYYFDFTERKYVLTEKATEKAKESYDEYVETQRKAQESGIIL